MKFLTVQEVAELIQVRPARVYEAVRLELLPAIHIGRQVRIEERAFRDWVRTGGQRLASPGQNQAS